MGPAPQSSPWLVSEGMPGGAQSFDDSPTVWPNAQPSWKGFETRDHTPNTKVINCQGQTPTNLANATLQPLTEESENKKDDPVSK